MSTMEEQAQAANERRQSFIGQACTYVDPVAGPHAALITAVHGFDDDGPTSVNLVYVVDDEAQHDQYGRQIERKTSVVVEKLQAAHGMYFRI